MKNFTLLITLIFISIINVLATEQIPDLLIIEKDKLYLKTFPLEDFISKNKINKAPFKYGEYSFPNTACWRGYQAIWGVINNKLFLIEIIKVDSTQEKLDIENYCKSINYSPIVIDGLIYADWYSDTLKRYENFSYYFNSERFYLSVDCLKEPEKKIELIFDKGQLTSNRIMSLDSYKKGDVLTKEISYYRPWFLKRGLTRIEAVIMENNDQMVRVEIKDFGTTKRLTLKKIKTMMEHKGAQEYWINPRYWDKKNE